jgi:hypothetical protein
VPIASIMMLPGSRRGQLLRQGAGFFAISGSIIAAQRLAPSPEVSVVRAERFGQT